MLSQQQKLVGQPLTCHVLLVLFIPSRFPLPPSSHQVQTLYARFPGVPPLPSLPWFSPRLPWVLHSVLSRSLARARYLLAFSLCKAVVNLSAPITTPRVPWHSVLLPFGLWPQGGAGSERESAVVCRSTRGSKISQIARQRFWSVLRQTASARSSPPLPPPFEFSERQLSGRRQSLCLTRAPASRSRLCRIMASTHWPPVFSIALAYVRGR